jgi:hypothetical protein
MKTFIYSILALLLVQVSLAQNFPIHVDMNSTNWEINDKTSFERFDNRETLVLKGGRITVKNKNFSNGTIEVDVYATSSRSFAGITFRKKNDFMEEVYLRLHKSNQGDAVQYTPIFNNESNWQLYREYQAKVSFKDSGWNTLGLKVNGESADIFVNGEKVMSVDHLRTDSQHGEIGLFALFTGRFSNFRFTPEGEVSQPKKENNITIDPTTITKWDITDAKPYKEGELQYEDFKTRKYKTVKTEASGLLPISKYVRKSSSGKFEKNAEDFVIASTSVYVNKAETKHFSFDYSDKIIVYLNGKILFKGNNAFRTKGTQYMGHLDINTNLLYLPLEKGMNTIHCVVIDKANGWGLIGKLE